MISALKNVYEALNEDTETTQQLIDLKKELAAEIVAKIAEKNWDFSVLLGEDVVADYLVDEGISDKVHDALVAKGLEALGSQLLPKLKAYREKIKKIWTPEELSALKSEIMNEIGGQTSASSATRETSSASQLQSPDGDNSPNADSGEASRVSSVASGVAVASTANRLSSSEKKEPLRNVEGFDPNAIKSAPARKNPKTGVTLCAATARINAQKFGLDLISGHAYDAGANVPKLDEYQATLPKDKKNERPSTSWEPLSIEDFYKMKDVNLADIFPDSKSKYGHRALAFRDQKGERMVLDPYIKIDGFQDTAPKPLAEYMKKRPVYKWHFFAVDDYRQVA